MADKPSVNSMINAIKCNSYNLVDDYFKEGFDANSITEIDYKLEIEEGPNNEIEQDVSPNTWFSAKSENDLPTVSMPIIHFAVRNCYEKFQQPQERINSSKILDLFLDHGASVTKTVKGKFLICNIVGYKWATMEENTTALDFAVYLKTTVHDNTRLNIMSTVVGKLSKTKLESELGFLDTQMTSVPLDTLDIWKSLVLNESFSDVYFICADDPNRKLYAHRAVLAAASDYFRVLFTGNWQESVDCLNGNGIRTNNSVNIMEGLLNFIYTGNINDIFINCNIVEILELSSQWGLKSLATLCERRCVQTLHAKSVIPILKFASSNNSESLKHACFKFIRRNSITVLTSKSGTALRSENIDLWNELMVAIGGEVESNTSEEEENDRQFVNDQV